MKKSIISLILVLCILLAVASPFAVHATELETYMVPNYQMYQNFTTDTYPILFRDRLYLATLDSSTSLGKYIDKASVIIGEDLSVERCTQLLANMATLMNYQLEEAIVEQATMDTTMTLYDYGADVADIAAGVVGTDTLNKAANSVIEGIATTMGLANGVLDVTVDTRDKLELLVQLEGDYSMQYDFLETVYMYADISEMKEAAQTLMLANEQIMLHKLEVFNSTTASAAKFAAHDVFLDQVAEDLLNDPDFFDSDAWLGVKALSTAYSLYSGAKLAFDITLFLGDVMFGVHDIYNRYNEMVAMRDIRQALLSRVEANPVLSEEDYDNMDRNISLMKMSLYIDARGEYCAYKMITEDGKLAKLFSTTNQKIIEDNYNASVRLIENSFENLEILYCEKEWGSVSNAKKLTQINIYDADGNLQVEYKRYYNENGMLTSEVNNNSEFSTYVYDSKGYLIEYHQKGSMYDNYFTYNEKGQKIKADLCYGMAYYEYDSVGRLCKTREEWDTGTDVTVYVYDTEGKLIGAEITCTEENGPKSDEWVDTVTYTYDSENRLIQELCEGEHVKTSNRYDYTFVNLVIDEYLINDERSGVFVHYYDVGGNDTCGLSLSNPRFYADAEGYLAKVVDTYTSYGKIETTIYEFYYDDVLAVPLDNPSDTSIIYEEVVAHTYEEAEKLLYEYLGNDYGFEGLEVRQVSETGQFEMTISGEGGAPIYIINWYTVNLDTGEVRNAETYRVVCDLW